ncbi:MipA/OmpV family protein [Solimonas marina]|uniref:MipA/OmpV family protein n=1 Tax=Solimonas marina TaxID=2714601 RepID=A0A969W7T8_9GAMM|nr:MipA/OmpV family protein [Solimonas marina]NKF21479.1 MipA/OmpV family protein [Solimonas marina]
MLRSRNARLALGALLAVPVWTAHAQTTDAPHNRIGIGVATIPDYPGSDERRTVPLPVLSLRLGDTPFYLGNPLGGTPLQAGLALPLRSHWLFGLALSTQVVDPRDASRDDRLDDLGNIDRTALGSAFIAYRARRFSATLRSTSDIGGQHQGTTVDLGLRVRHPFGAHWVLSTGPNLRWANGEHMQTYFGVDPIAHPTTSLPAYDAGAGIQSVGGTVQLGYRLGDWTLAGLVNGERLQGDAKDSPIVEQRHNFSAGLTASYSF